MAYEANLATRFPVYQIDFTSVASGKHIASTKRRIRWRFGFPNVEALNNGKHGTDCRGEEHEVVVVWSITSGKKLVFCDGQEVYTTSSRSSTFEHSWSMKGNHVLKIFAHANAPINPTPGYHQYDLFVDGQSFFIMPKVYEVGLSGAVGAHTRYPGVHVHNASSRYSAEAPRTRQEEETDLQHAIRASIMESKNHLDVRGNHVSPSSVPSPPVQANPPAVQKSSDDLLLDFNDAPATANPGAIVPSNVQPANQWGAPVTAAQRSVSHDTMTHASTHTPVTYASVGSQPPAPSYYAAPPQPAVAPYQAQSVPQSLPPNDTLLSVPSQTVDDPFAPKPAPAPTYNDIHNQILQSYQVDQNQAEIKMPETTPAPATDYDDTNFAKSPYEEVAPDTNTAGLAVSTSENKSDVDAAMGKLVNLLDLNTPASELSTTNKLTMKPLDNKNKQKAKYDDHFFGPKPTLGEMKALKSENAMTPVVPTPTNAPVGTGALVVSGQQSGNYSGYGMHPQMNQANMNAYSAPGMQHPGGPYNNGGAAPNNGFQQFNGVPGQMPHYGGSNYQY